MTEAAHPKEVNDEKLGTLPAWDLTDLYPAPDSTELENDLVAVEKSAIAFNAKYAGKLADLDGDALYAAIESFETTQEIMGKVMSYAYLVYAGNMSDPEVGKFFQSMQERSTGISSHILFFSLELNQLDEGDLQIKITDSSLAKYAPWLRDLRAQKIISFLMMWKKFSTRSVFLVAQHGYACLMKRWRAFASLIWGKNTVRHRF